MNENYGFMRKVRRVTGCAYNLPKNFGTLKVNDRLVGGPNASTRSCKWNPYPTHFKTVHRNDTFGYIWLIDVDCVAQCRFGTRNEDAVQTRVEPSSAHPLRTDVRCKLCLGAVSFAQANVHAQACAQGTQFGLL